MTIRAKPGRADMCLLRIGHLTFNASWGRTGRSITKREGDGATPVGQLPLLYGFYKDRLKNRAPSRLEMRPVQENMGWCDQSGSANYNKLVKKPDKDSHEIMLRQDHLYDIVIVLDWNITCRKRNCGSAIFFHIAKDGYKPTEGCIAISKRAMMRIMPLLSKRTVLRIL